MLLADDHPVLRDGLAAVLGRVPGLEVVGEAATGEEAVRQAQLLRPDVVLMDIRMPGVDGVEATRRLRVAVPDTAVLVLTMYDDDATVFAAMRAGARGYLLKDADHEEISNAIRSVVAGHAVFGPGVAQRALDLFAGSPSEPTSAYPFPDLTDREREILELLAAGRATGDIARDLYLSPKTVSNRLTSVFAKLGVADRTSAVIKARSVGLGEVGRGKQDHGGVRP